MVLLQLGSGTEPELESGADLKRTGSATLYKV